MCDQSNYVQQLRAKVQLNPSDRLRQIKAQTLAVFHNNNTLTANDYGGTAKPSSAETHLLESKVGLNFVCSTCGLSNNH
jgi:hypothetical protein